MKRLKKMFGVIIFMSIGLCLFMMISYMLRPLDTKENMFFRKPFVGFYGETKNSLDVVGIGSSSLYFYLDNPLLWEEYNMTSYNLSTGNQSNFIIEELMDEIEKTQSPQLYIVETRKFAHAENKNVNSHAFCYVIDNMKYSLNRIKIINHLVDDWKERINYYFDIVSYHESWQDFSYDNLSYIFNNRVHENKGWRNISKIKQIQMPQILSVTEENKMPISDESEKALISLLEKCKKENKQVLFLSTPWKIDEETQKKNNYMAELIQNAGFQFLDCNQYIEEIGLDPKTDFRDKKHVNMLGAEKVTRFIGNYIEEEYELLMQHDISISEEWDRTAKKNRSEADTVKQKMMSK